MMDGLVMADESLPVVLLLSMYDAAQLRARLIKPRDFLLSIFFVKSLFLKFPLAGFERVSG